MSTNILHLLDLFLHHFILHSVHMHGSIEIKKIQSYNEWNDRHNFRKKALESSSIN